MKTIKYSFLLLSFLTSYLIGETDLDSSISQDHTYEKEKPRTGGIELVDGWRLSGDIRAGWVQYDYQNKPKGIDSSGNITPTNPSINQGHIDSQGIYTMPKISISSPKNSRLKVKATLAGATDFGINDEKYEKRNFVFDSNERKSFLIIQEGYLSYEDKNHKALVGREELTTPMIDADDWYMLANSFELAYYTNSSLENITFNLGFFNKMSGVWDSGANGTEFHSMSDASFISSADKAKIADSGVYFAAVEYNDDKNHQLQVWNYYAQDMYNTLFMQYDFTGDVGNFSYDIGAQFINFKEVGFLASDSATTNIDYSLYSARFDGSFANGIDFATGVSKYTDGEGQGATLGAFGGYPYFANGMIFHFFEAGSLQNAVSLKAQLGYDFSKVGVDNLWIGYRYTYFDLDSNYSQNISGESQDAMALNGIRVSYGSDRGAYFTGTYEHVNLDNEPNTFSVRLIGGYKF